jgi:hypothetical protein
VRCFLSDKEDSRDLFKGLYIENSEFKDQANSWPVFLFDFKGLKPEIYADQIADQIEKNISMYTSIDDLSNMHRRRFEHLLANPKAYTEGLLLLTEIVYEATGKQSYILIDEYDKLLTDNYNSDYYEEIKKYETDLLSSGLKGNNYLKKALLTGVMRVSRESLLSGLNNLVTFEMYDDAVFTDDFGITDDEMSLLSSEFEFDAKKVRDWYNGIKVHGKAIYNMYSVMSFLKFGKYDNYWGRSGTIHMIAKLLNDDRRETIEKLLGKEKVVVSIEPRISLKELTTKPIDSIFYSLLVQAGYISAEELVSKDEGDAFDEWKVRIPNIELMRVWREFILSDVVGDNTTIRTMLDNIDTPDKFASDIEYYISDRLSYHDLDNKEPEKPYHVFILGIMSAYGITDLEKPKSNRESGDGRYDVLLEWKDYSIIFEFKIAETQGKLEHEAMEGLAQIDEKRYYADVPKDRKIVKVAIAFCKKQCRVMAK